MFPNFSQIPNFWLASPFEDVQSFQTRPVTSQEVLLSSQNLDYSKKGFEEQEIQKSRPSFVRTHGQLTGTCNK